MARGTPSLAPSPPRPNPLRPCSRRRISKNRACRRGGAWAKGGASLYCVVMNREPLNTLFDDEIQGHHSMRDLVLSLVSDSDLGYAPPGNPSFGELLVELGQV